MLSFGVLLRGTTLLIYDLSLRHNEIVCVTDDVNSALTPQIGRHL